VHVVVDNVACRFEVDRVDDFIIAIVFVAIQILSLPPMA